jgi:GNAT superfamily N-acetyltransferase
MEIREVNKADLVPLLELYTHLHDNEMPVIDEAILSLWDEILRDEKHHIIIGFVDGMLVSSCVITVIPNLTHNQRPYALIENVITHKDYRKMGYATLLLNYAREIARKNNCYKIMLLTGSKEESTLRFYEKAGYNMKDKTAFIQWLD